jgi:hypothetical protein
MVREQRMCTRDGYYYKLRDGSVFGPMSEAAFAREMGASIHPLKAWRIASGSVFAVSRTRQWRVQRMLTPGACASACELLTVVLGGGMICFALYVLRLSGELDRIPTSTILILAALVLAVLCLLPRALRSQCVRWRDASSNVKLDESV